MIPIDRLTDIRAPIEVAAARCGQQQLEAVYGIHLAPTAPPANSSSSNSMQVTQQQQLTPGTRLLLALARARGWVIGAGGLPDEARAGRQILKDYTTGKLLYCKLPPGHGMQGGFAPIVAPLPGTVNGMRLDHHQQQHGASIPQQQRQQQLADKAPAGANHSDDRSADADSASDDGEDTLVAAEAVEDGDDAAVLLLSEADLELMEGLGLDGKSKAKRPEHKFHKKAARSKGTRGVAVDVGGYDGATVQTGKKGGLVRVGGY